MFKGSKKERKQLEQIDFLDFGSISRGKEYTNTSGIQKIECTADSFMLPFSRLKCEYSFERGLVPSSSRRDYFCEFNKPGIASFEQEKPFLEKQSKFEGQKPKPKTKKHVPRVDNDEENMLQKRNLTLLAFTEDLINMDELSHPKQDKAKPAAATSRAEFILQKDTNDDFESDSECQAFKAFTLSSALLDKDYLESIKLTFDGCLNKQVSLHQDELFRIISFTDLAKVDNMKVNRRSYVCKYCGSIFHSGCALGGHISKIHRGVNLEYSRRIAQRKDTQMERDRIKYIKAIIGPK